MAARVSPSHGEARSALWAALLAASERKAPRTNALADAAGLPEDTALKLLRAWVATGHVEQTRERRREGGFAYRWRPVRRLPEAPEGGRAETAQDRLWRTMKMLKTFSAEDLAIHASVPGRPVSLQTARDYCNRLARTGRYLRFVERGVQGGAASLYRFVGSTGPRAPRIGRDRSVFDPNINEVVWRPDGGKADG
jgi:hypothetical protein